MQVDGDGLLGQFKGVGLPAQVDDVGVQAGGLASFDVDMGSESEGLVVPESVLEQLGLTEPGWTIEVVKAAPASEAPLPAVLSAPVAGSSFNAVPVVQEADFDHGLPWSAQAVPLANTVRVDGNLDVGDGIDLYKVPVREGTRALAFDLVVARPSPATTERMMILDGFGRLLDDLPVAPNGGRLHVVLRAVRSMADGFVYIGVYRLPLPPSDEAPPPWSGEPTIDPGGTSQDPPPTAGEDPAPTDYSLEITRQDDPSPPSGPPPETPATPTQSGGDPGSLPQPSTDGEAFFGGTASPVADASMSSDDRVLVAAVVVVTDRPSRPSPLRSAAPAGGSRRIGPATRPVDRRQAATIDMALLDLPSDETPDGEGDPSEEPPSPPPAVEEVKTPSGLPLLGALVPDLRESDRAPLREIPDLPSAAPASPSPTRISSNPAGAKDPQHRPLRARTAVRCCLGLAYALAFTLLLPDITAAVQRAEARRGRRPRVRRSLLRRFFGPRRG